MAWYHLYIGSWLLKTWRADCLAPVLGRAFAAGTFGDGNNGGLELPDGGFHFVYTAVSSNAALVSLKAGGMSGTGCTSAKWTVGVDSNMGTFVPGEPSQTTSGTQRACSLRLATDANAMGATIGNFVNPRIKAAEDAIVGVQGMAGAADKLSKENSAGVTGNDADIGETKKALKGIMTDLKTVMSATSKKNCEDVEHDFKFGTVKGLPFHGATLTFTAADGYFLDGGNQITCDGDTGQYDKSAPVARPCAANCLLCSGAADKCSKCVDSAEVVAMNGKCVPAPCTKGDKQHNLLLKIDPKVSSECYGPRLGARFLTDGTYQPQRQGSYVDKDYYHTCQGRGESRAAVYLRTPRVVKTVRVWKRCDCCPQQNHGIMIQSFDKAAGVWTDCGAAIESKSEITCTTAGPAAQYTERQCNGAVSAAVRLYNKDTDFMVCRAPACVFWCCVSLLLLSFGVACWCWN